MTQPLHISWLHIGDLHMDEADGWRSRDVLQQIVAEMNAHFLGSADFVFLPGDNANHGSVEQYQIIAEALAPLQLPYYVIPGDHDFETGNLDNYSAAFPAHARVFSDVVSGHRCLFLDVVSAGLGGPDFRLTKHQQNFLREELAKAQARHETPVVFMHSYPEDLADGGEPLARILADSKVAFVDTGHTHYNELLNDGRVIYGATRSTSQIEEDNGKAGFSIVTIYDGSPSWRFIELGSASPIVQIVSPIDLRLVTRPADNRQVPRPGEVEIIVKLFGAWQGPVTLKTDDQIEQDMVADAGSFLWRTTISLDAGIHFLMAMAGADVDSIKILVRPDNDIPRRGLAVALGSSVHSIGAWPERRIDGLQLGPNKNGRKW